ncbi:hypothetical protein BTJ40_07360 [Microbulbifer sp. A4B17]|uniref:hypothetical protein n=1 Tax=Microbulbifer sp. A4B17 TaxID=359370 RepID=UPI000D52EA8A|nr:hypothetical protein [Microbulbifer sp. A4B17]AWF80643.1 hypothetical protein BTJ40_07360 [Microbulbifer sp. A4B17]
MIVITMFSVFAPKQRESAESSITALIDMITILNFVTHFSWSDFGRTLSKALDSDKDRSLQNKSFALTLLLAAVWLIADNPTAISLTAA